MGLVAPPSSPTVPLAPPTSSPVAPSVFLGHPDVCGPGDVVAAPLSERPFPQVSPRLPPFLREGFLTRPPGEGSPATLNYGAPPPPPHPHTKKKHTEGYDFLKKKLRPTPPPMTQTHFLASLPALFFAPSCSPPSNKVCIFTCLPRFWWKASTTQQSCVSLAHGRLQQSPHAKPV